MTAARGIAIAVFVAVVVGLTGTAVAARSQRCAFGPASYYAGERFASAPTELVRGCRRGPGGRRVPVRGFAYERAGLEIQNWRACDRNYASYSLGPDQPLPREDLTLRGVPAAFYDDARRLELYTGTTTVVLFGRGRRQLLLAANRLRRAPGSRSGARANEDLPPPVPGAMEGDLRC